MSKDQSQWIFALPDSCIEKDEGNKPSIVKLQHPKSGLGAMFLLTHGDRDVYEITQFKEEYRSWFIGETVQRDGSLFYVTAVDPVFLILPYLIREAKSGKCMPLDQLVTDTDFPECHRLCSCAGVKHLQNVADVKGDDDFKAYKYNSEKTLNWLKAKVERLSGAIRERKLDVTGGASAAIFRQTNKSNANEDDILRYAFGMVSDYISLDLSKQLKDFMDIQDPVIEHEKPPLETPAAKKAKSGNVNPTEDYSQGQKLTKSKSDSKMTKAQKQLSQVDTAGMKSMMSFFMKKAKK